MPDTKKDEQKLKTSADAMRAPNDPTADPYHTRGIDPAAAEAGFRAAGYPEKGPLAGRDPGDKLDIDDIGGDAPAVEPGLAVADPGHGKGPNPTADSVPPAGGVVAAEDLIDDHSKIANPDPKDTRKTATGRTTASKK